MDSVFLSRIQFALTSAFHYIYPPLSIGLGVILVIMEGLFLKTRNEIYRRTAKFWVKVFGLTFSIGVASGIVLEFQFGTNWATYSRFVGDVFGSALAAEGVFAFFLESGFLALLLFGWDRLSPKMHFFSTLMVSLGSMFSAVWIVTANSWQQTPAGFHVVGFGDTARAEITDFWAMVFNPSAMDRLLHVLLGAWQAGAWLVISVSAYYLLKKKFEDFAIASMKVAIVVALVTSVAQLFSGHSSALVVAKYQPAKLAAMEGHFDSNGPAKIHLFGWVDAAEQKVKYSVGLPGMLSFLVHGDFQKPVQGLDSFSPQDRPPLNPVFQSFHIMVGIGFLLIGLSALGAFFWWRGTLFDSPRLLKVMVAGVILPQIANQLGWMTAEIGRQPWSVYNLLRTADSGSAVVSAGQVAGSLAMFTFIYSLLFALFIYLLDQKIRKGPVDEFTYGSHRAG